MTTKIESISPSKIGAESLATTFEDPDSDFDVVLTGLESSMEAQLIKLFKRFSLPFKKANRRLRDMEDIGQQLESTMGEIRTTTQIAAADIDRKFSDFFNMSLEMFDHQHHQIQMGEKTLAGISQCCKGTAADLSEFKARTESALDQIQSGNVFVNDAKSRSGSRTNVQLRFDTERILAVLKNQESLILDGFDKCYVPPVPNGQSFSRTSMIKNDANVTVDDESDEDYQAETDDLFIENDDFKATTTEMSASLVEGQPEPLDDAQKMVQTCEQLLQNGFLESKVYTMEMGNDFDGNYVNEKNRDFRQRFCDQTTSGGGWTVPNKTILVFVIVLACQLCCIIDIL